MQHEYSLDGFGALLDELKASDDDIEVRNYRIINFLDESKESWQYATDSAFRELVNRQRAIFTAYEEKVTPLYALQLEMEIIKDQATATMILIRNRMLAQLLPAYNAGNRDPRLLEHLCSLIKSEMDAGTYDEAVYGGLTLKNIGNTPGS